MYYFLNFITDTYSIIIAKYILKYMNILFSEKSTNGFFDSILSFYLYTTKPIPKCLNLVVLGSI
jgi:hypothetical protein